VENDKTSTSRTLKLFVKHTDEDKLSQFSKHTCTFIITYLLMLLDRKQECRLNLTVKLQVKGQKLKRFARDRGGIVDNLQESLL